MGGFLDKKPTPPKEEPKRGSAPAAPAAKDGKKGDDKTVAKKGEDAGSWVGYAAMGVLAAGVGYLAYKKFSK